MVKTIKYLFKQYSQ